MKQLVITALILGAVSLSAAESKPVFYFFHSEVCPHCVEAAPFIAFLKEKYPQVEFRELEVYRDLVNRELLKKKAQELGITKLGVPFFLIGKSHLSGFKKGEYEEKILAMLNAYLVNAAVGTVKPQQIPLAPSANDPLVMFQKEARETVKAIEACYETGTTAAVGDCLKKAQKRLNDLMTVIIGQTGELIDRINKSGKIASIPTKAHYLDQQALWKKQCDGETAMDEALCRAAHKENCDGLSLYLSVQNGQSRVQKLLVDLQALQEISAGR
ncbi:MAG TPA: thioredoxin family protein [bacterium]|nr:thioredoxin family protein [bacterium]